MSLSRADTRARRRFELKRRIGAGAFGEVFLAEQVGAGGFRRLVALKVLNESASRIKDAARRMRDEARILGRLSHRHLVDVLDLVQLGDRWAVVMAYVPGADLEQVLLYLEQVGERVPAPAACEVGAAVGKALHAAWTAPGDGGEALQVVHRDIKPSNVRITPDGEVKVLDFGVATVRLEEREAQTRRQAMIGTERYMAPERILMEGDGPEGDVYALGATVAELLLGEPIGRTPVRDAQHDAFVAAVVARIRAGLAGPEAVCDEVAALIGRTLAGPPADRPTALEVAGALDRAARALDGDDLAAFCVAVVPKVPEVLGTGSGEPVSGTLIEGSASSETMFMGDAGGSGGGVASTSPSPRRLLWVALLLLGLAGVAWFLGARSGAPVAGAPDPAVVAASAAGDAGGAVDAPAEEPEAVPAVEPAREPVPEPVAAPTRPAPTPERTRPAREAAPEPVREAAPVEVAPAEAPGSADPAPRVSRALVVVDDVSAFTLTCGDVRMTGTASVRIADFPAGRCALRAERGGRSWSTAVTLDRPTTVRCAIEGETLSCR